MVKESIIRMMTRLSNEHGAVNLSQGFPNESPPWELRLALAHGVLTGGASTNESSKDVQESLVQSIQSGPIEGSLDVLNQYSPPMGRADLRQAISQYYQRFYDYQVSPDDITVTLGATEAVASALRTIGRPGDKCVIIEPFHELYPSQADLFYLEPVYVSLRETTTENTSEWKLDMTELETALKEAKILLLNSPHNPTGKVFSHTELKRIVDLCQLYDVTVITDEIYEHMCYDDNHHILLPKAFPSMANRTLVCNSIGKSASATGWRLGWCLHPAHLRDAYRGVHDQLVVMSPHATQYASMTYTTLPDSYFAELCNKYQRRVQLLGTALKELGFACLTPQGAYYLFVNYRCVPKLKSMSPLEAATYLLTVVKVACVPGDNFYGNKDHEDCNKYLRFAACRSDADLQEATSRLKQLN